MLDVDYRNSGDIDDDAKHGSKSSDIDDIERYANEQARYDREFNDIAANEEGGGLYNAGDSDTDGGKAAGKEELNAREGKGGSAKGGKAASGKPDYKGAYGGLKRYTKKFLNRKNGKRAGIAAGVGGGIAGIAVGGLMMLGPLKLVHVMTNLRNEFFAASDVAGGRMNENLLQDYIIRKVIPGMRGGCTSTLRDRSCAIVGDSDNMVTMLYQGWRDKNLEGKLARNYGVEIVRRSNNFYLRAPGLNEDLDLGTYNDTTRKLNGDPYAKLSRTEVRRIMKTAFEGETLSKRIRYRFSVGELMERKYGIRRCLWACGIRDRTRDTLDAKKNALKLWVTERYIMPRSTMMGLAITCALADFDCSDPGDPNDDGERESQFVRDVKNGLREDRRVYGREPLTELERDAESVRRFGATEYIVRKLAGDVVGKAAGTLANKAVPIFGWLDAAASIYQGAQNAGPAVKHMNFIMNTTGAVALATMAFTSGDEGKAGHVDGTVQGSVASMFDEQAGRDQGGGGMEATPLYDYLMNGTSGQTQAANILDIFSPKAYAASSQKVTAYTCEDGKLVPAGELVCPVMGFGVLSTAGQIANEISKVANNPALSPVNVFAETWDHTFGWLYDHTVGWVVGKATDLAMNAIPEEALAATMKWIQDNIMSVFFVEQLGANSSGGRYFEVAALGTNVMANDTAQYIQGGRALTPEESGAIQAAAREERYEDFAAKPLYARMFDTEDSSSMVSRLALSIPSGSTSFAQNISSFVSNPFASLSNSFSTIFASRKAEARLIGSPFGLQPMGYALNHPALQPGFKAEEYWDANNCGDPELKKKWGAKATEMDQNTMIPIQRTEEPCMLIRSGIAESGGMIDKKFLLDDPEEAAAGGGATAPSGGNPTGAYVNPLQGSSYRCTSGFGPRWGTKHEGVDMALPVGNRVLAPTAGTVKRAGTSNGYGLVVVILGDDGFHYELGHISSYSVKVGDRVTAGVEVAKSGNTGQSTGPHLHFSVATGFFTGRIDPETHMASKGVTLCP